MEKLAYLPTQTITDAKSKFKISKTYLMLKNFGQWFKHLKVLKPSKKFSLKTIFKRIVLKSHLPKNVFKQLNVFLFCLFVIDLQMQ